MPEHNTDWDYINILCQFFGLKYVVDQSNHDSTADILVLKRLREDNRKSLRPDWTV